MKKNHGNWDVEGVSAASVGRVLVVLLIAVIFTLYLAPSAAKYEMADILVAVALAASFVTFGVPRVKWRKVLKPLTPLFFLLIYVVIQAVAQGGGDGWAYMRQLLFGFAPYLLFYLLFSRESSLRRPFFLLSVFILPGLVHLAYMYFDIGLAIYRGEMSFMTSSKHGFLEYVKDAPRVGRRYLSIACLQLLCGSLLMAWYLRQTSQRYWAWGLSVLGALSLALLDARAAYAASLIGVGLLVLAVGPLLVWQNLKRFFSGSSWWMVAAATLVIVVVGLGYSAGKSRWVAMGGSVNAAVHDVYFSETPLAQRPYVDVSYWNSPIGDIEACYLEKHFRCRIDQSAYLRTAWLLSGAQSLIKYPFGIGYSGDYMARLWGVHENGDVYQRSDNFFVEHIVSFGWVGMLLYGWLVWNLFRTFHIAVRSRYATAALVAVCGIIFVCVGRSLVDVFSDGLWRYFLALLGMYYGLLHSAETRRHGG